MSVTVHRLRPKARLCNQAVEDALLQTDRSPMKDAVARKIEEIFDILRPLHDRQVSDSMLETALGQGDGAA